MIRSLGSWEKTVIRSLGSWEKTVIRSLGSWEKTAIRSLGSWEKTVQSCFYNTTTDDSLCRFIIAVFMLLARIEKPLVLICNELKILKYK